MPNYSLHSFAEEVRTQPMPEIINPQVSDDDAAIDALLATESPTELAPDTGVVVVDDPQAQAAIDDEKADAAKAAAEAAQIEADRVAALAKAEKSKGQESDPERRKREYTGHLPTARQREIEIAAKNPDMPLAEVQKLAAAESDGLTAQPEDEPLASDILASHKAEFAELDAKLRECDKKFTRPVGENEGDFDWDKAMARRSELLVEIAELSPLAAREAEGQQSYDDGFAAAEEAAQKLLPDLANEDSDAWQACAGRSLYLKNLADDGKPLPTVEIDGRTHALDPRDPNFPYLVAYEQAAKLGKTNAAEAKPAAQAEQPPVKRLLAPVPGAAPATVARKAPIEGMSDKPTLHSRTAALKTDADLDKFLDEGGDDTPALKWGSRHAAVAN